jgi:hypothetical protein
MAKFLAPLFGVIAGFPLGVAGFAALDSWLSPLGTVFGARDEMGVGHEVVPIVAGILASVVGGLLGWSLWGKRGR